MKKNIVYYALITRNGWIEFHVSRDRTDVTLLIALSRRIAAVSPHANDFVAEVAAEVKALDLQPVNIWEVKL